jgi:hypothetical protein
MSEPRLGYSREGDVVTLRMTRADYGRLTLFLGLAGGVLANIAGSPRRLLDLANRINEGNPEWRRFVADEEVGQ